MSVGVHILINGNRVWSEEVLKGWGCISAGGVLVECLRPWTEFLSPGTVAHTYNLSTQKWRLEDEEFEVTLSYIVSGLLAWEP